MEKWRLSTTSLVTRFFLRSCLTSTMEVHYLLFIQSSALLLCCGSNNINEHRYFLTSTEIQVGYNALPHLSTHSDNTIYNAKRFIGRRYLLIVSLPYFYDVYCCLVCFAANSPFPLLLCCSADVLMFIFSLQEEDVRAYAAEHPYHVVDSRLSNYSKVAHMSYIYRAS